MPHGATTPRPVTATRRPRPSTVSPSLPATRSKAWPTVSMPSSSSSVDRDVELLLERHHQLDEVEAVGVEVVAEAGLGRDLLLGTASTSTAQALEPLEEFSLHGGLLV